MPEERGLYPELRIGDQLEYFAVLRGASHQVGRAATRSWLDRLGLGEREGARVAALSHGNQQRVQLAAALVHDPDLRQSRGVQPGAPVLEPAALGAAEVLVERPASDPK